MIKDDRRLREISVPILELEGLALISGKFFAAKEFQATWRKNGNQIELKVSDYLIDAPDDVLEDFVMSVVMTISKKQPQYGQTFLDWVRSDDYINEKRKIYLRRSKNLTRSPQGNERDLLESLDRLLDSSLLSPPSIDNSFFSWTSRPNVRKVGYCSPMMRVVGISSALDSCKVPEFVLDYVVYHEALHLAQGYRPGVRAHDTAFRNNERKYPKFEEAEKYLKTLKNTG